MDSSAEIPQYFICPISLQLMKDPVTASTGITYDRESIERWIFTDGNANCPVTNQPLPKDAYLFTPNHTLRRLIQAWSALHASDRVPTPKSPLTAARVLPLLRDLSIPRLKIPTLRRIPALSADNESNRRCMLQSEVPECVVRSIVSAYNDRGVEFADAALAALRSLRVPPEQLKPIVDKHCELVGALTWLLTAEDRDTRSFAVSTLKQVLEVASRSSLETLKPEFFGHLTRVIRDDRITEQETKGVLQVLLLACPARKNRTKMVAAGVVSELIELELLVENINTRRRATELALAVLDNLCECADGRAELVGHAAGIAVVTDRILRVSGAADERAVSVVASLCRYSATNEVLQEMARVGTVQKLCFVLQSNNASSVKEKATWILRLHSGAWRNSPCVLGSLLSSYP